MMSVKIPIIIETFLFITCFVHTSATICPVTKGLNCPTNIETDNGINVTWPETSSGTVQFSTPFCLDANKNPVIRHCCDGVWSDQHTTPQCSFYVYNFTFKCPPRYRELSVGPNRTICVLLTQPKSWNGDCVSSGSEKTALDLTETEWGKLHRFLVERKVQHVWLPARRESTFEPLVWKLVGYKWNRPVEFEDYPTVRVRGTYLKGNCLKLVVDKVNKTNLLVEVDNCEKKVPFLFIYDHSLLLRSDCEGHDGFVTRYRTKGRCFYIETFPVYQNSAQGISQVDLFQADSSTRIQIYEEMVQELGLPLNSQCLVRINELHDPFTVLDYTGKLKIANEFNCVVYERQQDLDQPELNLKFDESRNRLSLTVYSSENIWRDPSFINATGINCFTNADNELVKVLKVKRLIWSGSYEIGLNSNSTKNISKLIYEVKMAGDGPGYYWCEAHTQSDLRLIRSPKIVAWRKRKGTTYSALMDLNVNTTNIFERKFLKNLARNFRDHLRVSSIAYDHDTRVMAHRISSVRVMKIERYESESARLEAIFQLTINQNETVIRALDSSFLGTPNLEQQQDVVNEIGVDEDSAEYYRIKSQLYRVLQLASTDMFKFRSLNSTEYCLPNSLSVQGRFNWLSARVGTKSLSRELCLLKSGMPLAVKCEGDFVYGGVWENIDTEHIECIDDLPEITRTLATMNESSLTPEVAKETIGAMSEMTTNATEIIAADVVFLCRTVSVIADYQERSSGGFIVDASVGGDETVDAITTTSATDVNVQNSLTESGTIDRTYYDNLALILNNIMAVNESIVQRCQQSLNSTNILLDSFDHIMSLLTTNESSSSSLTDDDGTFLLVTPRLLVFITDPSVDNISGISLHRRTRRGAQQSPNENIDDHSNEENFSQYEIRRLRSNQTVSDLLRDDTLELATFLPTELIQRIGEADAVAEMTGAQSNLKIVINIYYNDRLFPGDAVRSLSKVVSVSLPGHGTDLPVLLPTVFRSDDTAVPSDSTKRCGYWDFSGGGYGQWSTEGCVYLGASDIDSSLIACGCTHLTHFAYLIMGTHYHQVGSDDHKVVQLTSHTAALDIITFVGCLLSLFGVLGIVITALVFKSWREKPGTKVLLHLSAAIALEMVLIAFVNTESMAETLLNTNKTYNCIMLGASLHYSILVAFSWMLITAMLQFMRYVKVLGDNRPPRFLLKSTILGWGAPLIPVLITSLVSPDSYIPPIEMVAPGICYPKGNALYFGLLLPVAVIVIANLVIFVIVMYNIFKLPDVNLRATERDLLVSQLRLSINLFFLLGLSWIFGLATVTKGGIIFSYLFCLTATLQGFVLFVYFIIMDPVTRKFWQLVLSNLGLSCTQKSKDVE